MPVQCFIELVRIDVYVSMYLLAAAVLACNPSIWWLQCVHHITQLHTDIALLFTHSFCVSDLHQLMPWLHVCHAVLSH